MHSINEPANEISNGSPNYSGPMEIKIGQRSASNGPGESYRIKKVLVDNKNLLRSVLLKNSLRSISQSRVVSRECLGLKRSTLQLIALQAQVLTSINTNDNQEEKMEECVKRGDQQVNSKPPIWKRKISNANTNTTAASNDSPMLTTQKKMLINLKLNPSRRSSDKLLNNPLISRNEPCAENMCFHEAPQPQNTKSIGSSPVLKSTNKFFWNINKEAMYKKSQTAESKYVDSRRPHIYRMKKLTLPPINASANDKNSLRKPIKFMSVKVTSDSSEKLKIHQIQNRSNSISKLFI